MLPRWFYGPFFLPLWSEVFFWDHLGKPQSHNRCQPQNCCHHCPSVHFYHGPAGFTSLHRDWCCLIACLSPTRGQDPCRQWPVSVYFMAACPGWQEQPHNIAPRANLWSEWINGCFFCVELAVGSRSLLSTDKHHPSLLSWHAEPCHSEERHRQTSKTVVNMLLKEKIKTQIKPTRVLQSIIANRRAANKFFPSSQSLSECTTPNALNCSTLKMKDVFYKMPSGGRTKLLMLRIIDEFKFSSA